MRRMVQGLLMEFCCAVSSAEVLFGIICQVLLCYLQVEKNEILRLALSLVLQGKGALIAYK